MSPSPRSRLVPLVLPLLLLAGCGGGGSAKVFKSDDLESGSYTRIAVLPFMRGLGLEQAAPAESAEILQETFLEAAGELEGYDFKDPPMIESLLGKAELAAAMETFAKAWVTRNEPDPALLARLRERLEVDAVILGVVDLWQKYSIGATISMIRATDGELLWQATDEYYAGGMHSESTGRVYQDLRGNNVYSEVVDEKTLQAQGEMARDIIGNILESFPNR